MNYTDFEIWLKKYGAAWKNQNAESARKLFTPDALYYWSPFNVPNRGSDQIYKSWQEAVASQKDIKFNWEYLAVEGNRGVARWWCSFVRLKNQHYVKLDGIFLVDFSENGLCREFREWWRSSEDKD